MNFCAICFIKVVKLAIVATDNKKRRCSPSPSPPSRQTVIEDHISNPASLPPVSTHFGGIMPPSAPFLTWSPILLPPWGPALFPAALYPAALRSLPGFVKISVYFGTVCLLTLIWILIVHKIKVVYKTLRSYYYLRS